MLLPGRRCIEADVDHVQAEAGDPLHQTGESFLIWQLGVKGCRAWAYGDRAVVEFPTQSAARLTQEGDLLAFGSHQVHPRFCGAPPANICTVAGQRHQPPEGDLDSAGFCGRSQDSPGTRVTSDTATAPGRGCTEFLDHCLGAQVSKDPRGDYRGKSQPGGPMAG